MPSLSMPSRRPFTERGKQMGRLKIAVAGANGRFPRFRPADMLLKACRCRQDQSHPSHCSAMRGHCSSGPHHHTNT
jgi:hypothetical protein